jgi:hypothetical protein
MDIISLKNPYPNGVPEKDNKLLQPFIDVLNEIIEKVNAGERVYLRITSGERKGSIAYIQIFPGSHGKGKQSIIKRDTWLGWKAQQNQMVHIPIL